MVLEVDRWEVESPNGVIVAVGKTVENPYMLELGEQCTLAVTGKHSLLSQHTWSSGC